MTTTMLRHARVELALHTLRPGPGLGLLLLHGLGDRSPATVPDQVATWPGAVHALDFTGHGASAVPTGGGYTCEMLLADADTALRHLGPSTVVGFGLGGYVGLLLAGARPSNVRGLVIADGQGLAGGGRGPGSSRIEAPLVGTGGASPTPDPWALIELTSDVRPPDYAQSFVGMALLDSDLDSPITVTARSRPPWLSAVVEEYGVRVSTMADALASYAR